VAGVEVVLVGLVSMVVVGQQQQQDQQQQARQGAQKRRQQQRGMGEPVEVVAVLHVQQGELGVQLVGPPPRLRMQLAAAS
jgi:hypothetical protein